ncbi:MAG: hypothetical protein U9R02_08350 [Thermodesulfobacteriota bacterium]|nr:hypothetical protein [Thermodesulfobacteriota bacterium]
MNAENGWDEFFDKVFNALKVKFKEIYPFKEDDEVSPDIVALRDAIFKLPCPVKVLELRFDEAKFAHVKDGLGILLRYDLSRICEKQIEDYGVMDVENIDVLKSVLIDKFGFSESTVADFVSDFKTTGIWEPELDYYIHFTQYDIRRYFDKYLSGLCQIFLYDRSSQLIQKFKRENDFNFLYNLKEDKVLPWEVFTNRDPALNNLSRKPTVEDLQKDICDIQLIPTVPEEVKKIFKAAKDLYVFGYFRWYFFTISEHYANLAIESAIRHRYNQYLGEKVVLTCKGADLSHEIIKPSYEGIFEFCKQNRKLGWNYHKLKVNGENFPWRMGELLDWLLKNGIQTKWQRDRLKFAIDMRNALSHLESVKVRWIGTTELKRASVLINNLYHQERNGV